MNETMRSLLAEPEVPNPPAAGWIDGLLVIAVLVGLSIEGVLRDDIVWKPVALIVFALLSYTLLIRRQRPIIALGAMIGSIIVLDVAAAIAGQPPIEVYSGVFVLVLVYALFRWGSGRHAAAGLGLMAAVMLEVQFTNFTGLGDLIGGALVLLFPAAVATVIRYQTTVRVQRVDRIKLHERERLARDLHDTVAHHVSAIAIQAQAGQALAPSSPQAAVDALAVIEEEASRTLAEMRSIVQALRDDEDGAEHAPQRGVDDIVLLGQAAGADALAVEVEVVGNTTGLTPSLDAGLYRLAQEAVTNARRHARNATTVTVRVCAEPDAITLLVSDDGATVSGATNEHGWGLVGMTERAELLGGTLTAGPRPPLGWQVRAVLPRNRSAAATT